MAKPGPSPDDETRKQEARYFIKNASSIPRLLQNLQTRSKDLDNLLMRLDKFISYMPSTPINRFIFKQDIIWKVVVEMFSAGILGTVVDILLSDMWYTPSQDPPTVKLEVLARAIRVLSKLLCVYSESEDDRARTRFVDDPMPTQNSEGEIVNLFKKLWQRRHYILPIPAADKTFWELKKENTDSDAYERLESAVVQLVVAYADAFATRVSRPKSTYKKTPKYVLESGLLHLHCLARTEQFANFTQTVLTQPRFTDPFSSLESLHLPLWLAVTEDPIERRGMERQLLMRLLDDSIIDRTLAGLISTSLSYTSDNRFRIDQAYRHQVLHRSTRAMERQVCRGTLQNLDPIKHSHVTTEFCGILHICLIQHTNSYDMSKLDIIGVLTHFNVPIILYEINKIPAVVTLLQHCIKVAKQYKTTASYRCRFSRLVWRARVCVPSTIRALKQMPIPAEPQDARDLIAQCIQAWTDYALVLGVSPSPSVGEDPVVSSETFLSRTCALRTCLCHGKKSAHKMRLCAGCWEVFYCGEKCQTEHWEKWGHRERCRRWRA